MTKEERKEYNKKYKEKNKDRIREQYLKKYKLDKTYHKDYYEKVKNNSEYKDKVKKYKENNKGRLREYNKNYQKERRRKDKLYNISSRIRTYIINTFKNINSNKISSTNTILGCSFGEFKKYLELHFEPWMTWDNYGKYNGELNYGWDIDHVVPLSSAKTEEEIIKLFHYTNLKPLCTYTNRYIKRNKTID